MADASGAPLTLTAVAAHVGATLHGNGQGDGDMVVRGIAPIDSAGASELTFLTNPGYRKRLPGSAAAAVLVAEPMTDVPMPQLVVANPYYAYACLMDHFHGAPRTPAGISVQAWVADTAVVGEAPDIGPFTSVGDGAVLGDRVTLHPGVRVGTGCVIGDDVILHANVVVGERCRLGNRVIVQPGAVIGGDGFGYATHQGADQKPRHHKIRHVGIVVLEDDVELGANTTVDRAVLGETRIGAGTKVDNLVQFGHNVKLGRGCLIVSQSGVSGSSVLGDYVVVGGQAGIVGHVTIGDHTMVGGKSAVTNDLPGGVQMAGNPVLPLRDNLKVRALTMRLPELLGRIKKLEQQLAAATPTPDSPASPPSGTGNTPTR